MHWIATLTVLGLTSVTSLLIFFWGWEPWQAYLAIGCVAVGVILVLLVGLWRLSGGDRKTFWHSICVTFRSDLKGLLDSLKLVKRR